MENPLLTVASAENHYTSEVNRVISDILMQEEVKIILVSGPSCAGKTTTSKRIIAALSKKGKKAYNVSLDDYYRADIYKMKEEKPDYEALSCLDLDEIHSSLRSLTAGKETPIPIFNFKSKTRENRHNYIRLEEGDVCIIEGLHALNPAIYAGFVDENEIADIYLNTKPDPREAQDARLYRRVVRDYFHRASSAEVSFSLWENVIRGEKNYIEPFAYLADYRIFTYHDYEKSVLKPFAEKILAEVSKDSEYITLAEKMLAELSMVEALPSSVIPASSLLQEFIPHNN